MCKQRVYYNWTFSLHKSQQSREVCWKVWYGYYCVLTIIFRHQLYSMFSLFNLQTKYDFAISKCEWARERGGAAGPAPEWHYKTKRPHRVPRKLEARHKGPQPSTNCLLLSECGISFWHHYIMFAETLPAYKGSTAAFIIHSSFTWSSGTVRYRCHRASTTRRDKYAEVNRNGWLII